MDKVIDIVLVTYRPDGRLPDILRMLREQKMPPRQVHLINTEKRLFDEALSALGTDEQKLCRQYPFLDIIHIRKQEFDHAGTRNLGMHRCSGADFVCMMTQDAVPADEELLPALAGGLCEDEKIAVAYARQIPAANASAAERFSRSFNYPEKSSVKTQQDFARLGIKTYFCSDVCAMYRKQIFDELGGFSEPSIFNEDMVFAGTALQHGYAIRYEAGARVVHSHNYGAMTQLRRNFDLGVSQADHPEIFAGAKSEGEGARYVRETLTYLRENGAAREIPVFLYRCAFRLTGYRLGKAYQRLPASVRLHLTSNKEYWKNPVKPGAQKTGKHK